MRRALAFLIFLTLAPLAQAQTHRLFYVDYAGGLNSNAGTSTGSPWKTAPPMNHGGSCDSGGPSGYAHQAGDQFVFKGGSTWPSACFQMTIPAGSSTAQDYYGVCVSNADFASETNLQHGSVNDSPCANGTSWPSSGWTRPIFGAGDLNLGTAQTANGGSLIASVNPGTSCFNQSPTIGYITIDNIEMAAWGISILPNAAACYGPAILLGGSNSFTAGPGTLVENMYIHDYVVNTNGSSNCVAVSGGGGCPPYGIVYGAALFRNSIVNDQNGYYFIAGVKKFGNLSGGCAGCGEAYGNHISYGYIGCSSVGSCHDSEFDHIQGGLDFALHTHVLYEDATSGFQTAFSAYNNAVHDNSPGLLLDMYYHSSIFNNVFWNNGKSPIKLYQCPPGVGGTCQDSTSQVGYVANNTINGLTTPDNDPAACYSWDASSAGLGTLNWYNNICIPGSAGVGGFSVATINGSATNYTMGSTEATTFGFVPANKLKPSSPDSNTVAQGTNLTSFGIAALDKDTNGAAWFGGSYISRPGSPTLWDRGAYQGQGGSTGPPSAVISAPTNGATISGSTVTLTSTCTPQGSATVASIQLYVDGQVFGSAGSSSPYSPSPTLDSTKLSNGSHTIYSVCTDSNMQTSAPSGTVTVTASNSTPGCTTSDPRAIFSQGFTTQTGDFTATWTETPNSAANDTVMGLSSVAAVGYGSMAALLRANVSGIWDAYNGSVGNYAAVNSAPYVSGTTYTFSIHIHQASGTYDLSETSPSSIVIASGYTYRLAASSLSFFNLISSSTIYDTAKLCAFQIGSATSLTFSPMSLNFGNVTVNSGTPTQTIGVTSAGGATTFSSVAVTGNADFTKGTDTCSGSQSSCSTAIQFAPTATGLETAVVTYTDNATGSPQTIPVSGTGVAVSPTLSCLPSSLDFGGIKFSNPPITAFNGPITCTITNPPTTFTTVATSGGDAADFGIAANTCTGTVSASTCSITLKFSPSRIGAETTTLVVSSSDASNSPRNVTLTGAGVSATPPIATSNSMFMASVSKLFQVPVSFKQRFTGTVPFTALINFICTGCDVIAGTCASCTAQ